MPEVIVIDEIGTELEAQAARTIAERGVQLVGTAHGNTLENLIINPTLSDLIGGIQSVTLGDEEAKRRGTQKSILERMSPPTFDIVVEIQERDRVAIHPDVAEAVDATLRGQPMATETRWLDEMGEVRIERIAPVTARQKRAREKPPVTEGRLHRVYLFGVNRDRFEQMIREIGLDPAVAVVNNLNEANIFVTAKHLYRRKPQKVKEAETAGLPVFVLRSTTPSQIRQLLNTIHGAPEREEESPLSEALHEAEAAVDTVKSGTESVELSPQSAYIRRLQHLIAERNALSSQSSGREPERRVRIFKAQ
jgi:hypothetical protein